MLGSDSDSCSQGANHRAAENAILESEEALGGKDAGGEAEKDGGGEAEKDDVVDCLTAAVGDVKVADEECRATRADI